MNSTLGARSTGPISALRPVTKPAAVGSRRGASNSNALRLPRAARAICGQDLRDDGSLSLGRRGGSRRSAAVTAEVDGGDPFCSVDDSMDSPASLRSGMLLDPDVKTFSKILCANRGEIAVRVFRAGTELGSRTVAIYSPQDRLQQHRYKADESFCVGEGSDLAPVDCYLAVDEIVRIAKENGVEAIHPGYGFLSERADFARKCNEEGIVFVGPKAETLDMMGDKTAARSIAQECEIPVIPGTDEAVSTPEQAVAFVEENGLPVILKAAMGGGGRGMRVVREKDDLVDLFKRASSEAQAAFGDGRMFIERFIERPRHIEVQIMADNYGNVVHLHERDCSVQRRHQKVVEMAPSVGLSEETKAAIFGDAVKLAKHIDYRCAGTVEFLVDEDGTHYFIEVNPRVQVEHTVTEEVTGIDIVQTQLRIAAGMSLEELGINNQEDITCRGFAIQSRVTTEDPTMNFQPDTGRIEVYRAPGGMGVRLDGASGVGSIVSPYYDSLLVKVTVKTDTFMHSVQKLYRALTEFRIRGVKTNIPFLQNVLTTPSFLSGCITTNFVDETPGLFDLPTGKDRATRLLTYLADMVVSGPDHPGAIGPPPEDIVPEIPATPEDVIPSGWKQVLEEKGPKEFAKAIREHKGLLLTDTTWRDAHQSLLATRMRTYDMKAAAPYTAHALAGAFSLEMWGGATFDVSMRFLHECPWDRLEILRKAVPNIPFQMLLRGTNAVGYTTYPDNVVKAFVKEAVKRGVDIFRVFDSLNYIENLRFGIEAVHEAGGVVEATICYTGDVSDPTKTKYTIDYYLEFARELVACDVHILCIKDMAGLLKPAAARMLVGALREEFPDIPIHVHTHDTAGAGVASMIAAAEAGADIVDCAQDSFSGLTSQPSMGALVAALQNSELDTGLQLKEILPLMTYWEQVRGLYRPYECTLRSGSSDVYMHEMPGGQYTNLKFQATSLGLGDQWNKVKDAYAAANRLMGDIVKVTPSSKVVGDMAQFMVSNNLDEAAVLEQASTLSFPTSVVEYFQGYIGQPYGGFPSLQQDVVGDLKVIDGRPGATMEDTNLRELRRDLAEKYPNTKIRATDVLSAALYPKVFNDFQAQKALYSDLTVLPTKNFLVPMEADEEVKIELETGKTLFVTYKALGELKPNGFRDVFFELNGIPRVVEVFDKTILKAGAASSEVSQVKERADPATLGSVGAPMAGEVIEIKVKEGDNVEAGAPLLVMSAMKMETTVAAPCSGHLQHLAVATGDSLKAGDLVVLIEEN